MNRLAHEKSAYLRQHADNPVDWYPWGDEALARARTEHKPILLSVGYSACHWCHVMAHESFEDPDTAREMNTRFINIKVDREERPDVDQLYQGVVQLMGRGGGWPLTVFLTPQLRPFYGGTYFPKEDRYGLPSFKRLLSIVHDAFVNRADDVEAQAKQFMEGLESLGAHGLDNAPGELSAAALVSAARAVHQQADPVNGGFGRAPKFPGPMNVQLLLRGWRRGGGDAMRDHVALTLDRMAQGGLFDQLGGGFHRYSVDERWLVPHFEKMLYDNAQLLHLYSEAYRVLPRPLWKKTVEETVAYVAREMTAPGGAFFATQDADSEGEEGKFFVWRPEEVEALLPTEDAKLLAQHLGITPSGNFEHGATVLEVVADVAELARRTGAAEAELTARLDRARQVLFEAREKRVKPGRDEKILAGWNGLMIRGLAAASATFGRPEWAAMAARAADFLLAQLWDGKRLLRLWQDGPARIDGFIDDYGALAAGLTALYQVTFEAKYVEAAEALAGRAVALFWDEKRQAYLSAPRGQEDLVAETFALHDNATPSGASSLTEAQVALAALTGRARHLEQAERYLEKMAESLEQHAPAFGHLWLAADAYLDGAPEVTLIGPPGARDPLLETLRRAHAPTFSVVAFDPASAAPPVLAEVLQDRGLVEGRPAAYVCRHFACQRPVTEPSALDQALRGS